MPELPEVETICRGLRPILVDRRIARVEQRRADLRWPLPQGFAADLTGRRIEGVARRGKYILVALDGGLVWMVHLGMSGRLYRATASPNGPHDHVVLHMSDGGVLRFNDARRFGMMDLVPATALDAHWLLASLGPDPLDPALADGWLAPRLAGKRTPIKAALLDQRVVAGVGNIYACEALFRAGLSPRRQACSVQGGRAARLGQAVRAVLNDAIAAGGSSLRDYVQADGELGYFQHRFAVYDREGTACPGCDCGAGVRRIVQSGRSTFYCAKRQR